MSLTPFEQLLPTRSLGRGRGLAAWLWGIIANLLILPGYFDVALRDFGLSLGALALGRLSHLYGPGRR